MVVVYERLFGLANCCVLSAWDHLEFDCVARLLENDISVAYSASALAHFIAGSCAPDPNRRFHLDYSETLMI
jgi:hypothetical protein